MAKTRIVPRYVVIQHTFAEHQEILLQRLADRQALEPLAPFCQDGEVGTWRGIRIACYSGPARETTLVPILEQEGVEYVFSLGLAGALSRTLRRGDLASPTASVRGDGLTDYWADPQMPAVADATALIAINESARRLGITLTNGVFYTTPTLHREPQILEKWAEFGLVGIQMELAQHLLLCHLHGKKAAGVYVISDLPLEGEHIWRTGIELDEVLSDAYARAVDVVLGAIVDLKKRDD